jgi:hypothetical protein
MSNVQTISTELVPLQPERSWLHAWGPVNAVSDLYWGSVWGFLNLAEEAEHRFTADEVRELIRSTRGDETWALATKWIKSTTIMMRRFK